MNRFLIFLRRWLGTTIAILGIFGCASSPEPPDDSSAPLPLEPLPVGFPEMVLPDDSPVLTPELVELGRHLFYDKNLSRNRIVSCATCHKQELAFTDGLATSTGSTGAQTQRNSMSLVNVAYASTLTWSNPLLFTLEQQALIPLFATDPVEMGLRDEAMMLERLVENERYQALFEAAYPDEDEPITLANSIGALAGFQRNLISANSPFDRWLLQGDVGAINDDAKRGYALFSGHPFECTHCHVDFNLTDASFYEGKPTRTAPFHNNGLYDLDGEGAYPEPNLGIMSVTGDPKDMGRFKAPSLRNVAVTAPYMHDGSLSTLDDVLDHYSGGGARSVLQSALITGFELTKEDRKAMHAFFESLTDQGLLKNPAFGDPWPRY